jgi:hypothetical protein
MGVRLVSCGVVTAIALASFGGCGGSDDKAGPDAGNGGSAGDDAAAGDDTSGSSSGASSSGAMSSSGGTDGSASDVDGGHDASTAYDPSVLQHHKNGTRNGLYIDPVFTTVAAKTTHVLSTFMGTVTTSVFAQPLYVTDGPGGKEAFIVASGNNHVAAYDGTTGATIWDKGPETYGPTAVTGCSPTTLGITGTPIIDYGSGQGVIYFDAVSTLSGGTGVRHLVYAAKVADGTVLPSWPVDVSAVMPAFQSTHQNQRGALQLINGTLYVPYGGYNGDCDPYFGWVVAFPLANPQKPTGWHTPGSKGGIWGPGALPTDGTSVFPITGNTSVSGNTWGGGEAVVRLGAGATFSGNAADYYAPTNWKDLDNSDADLGGASEVIFDMPGAPKPHLIAAGGKDSNFYLLNRDNLGGIGTTTGTELLKQSIATSQLKGAPAVYTTAKGTYVVFHVENGTGVACPNKGGSGNLVAVKVTASASGFKAAVAWCSTESNLGSPMVTTTDGTSDPIVWAASNELYAYDGDTGARIVDGTKTAMGSGVQGWNTPIAAKGRIAVGVNGALYVFTP